MYNLLVALVTSTEIVGLSFNLFNKYSEVNFSTKLIVITNVFPDSKAQFTIKWLAFIGDILMGAVTLIGLGILLLSVPVLVLGLAAYKRQNERVKNNTASYR